MPSTQEHEALHRIFQEDPGLFARAVARALKIDIPEPNRVMELDVDLTEFRPVVERRADDAGLDDTPGLRIWRALMATETFPYSSQLRSKGRAEGEAVAILRILKRRNVEVDDDSRERIESCTDLETLGTWLDRSLDVKAAGELFAGDI